MALTINLQDKEGVTILVLSGKLICGEGCDTFSKQIEDLLQKNKNKIILNLEEVNFCDSSGLGYLIKDLNATREQGGDLKLLKPSQKVQDLLDLTKLSTVFDIHSTEDEAVASFK